MIHVYQIPLNRSPGYCFGGSVPVMFQNLDWMDFLPEHITRENLEEVLRSKNYVKDAAPGTEFLVLVDYQPGMTFSFVKEEEPNDPVAD